MLTACQEREIPAGWSATDLPVPAPLQINTMVTAIDANGVPSGRRNSLAVMEDGSLWSLSGWGGWRRFDESEREPSRGHAKIMEDVIAVSAGYRYTMAITSDNVLWGWGNNWRGKLGDGTTEERHSPVKIMEDVIAVSAGDGRTVAITADNVLWGWGSSIVTLEDGTIADSHRHVRLMDDVTAVSVGGNRIMAITSDGTLWHLRTSEERRRILDDAVAVSVGSDHAVAITSDGSLWSWGRNQVSNWGGMLGDGTFRSSREPIKIMDGVVAVAAGGFHTLAITDDGSLWAWGENEFGQLGIGTTRGEYEQRQYRGRSPSTWLSPILVLEYVPEG